MPPVLHIVLVSLLRFAIQGFDENGNDIIDDEETVNLFEEIEQFINSSFDPEMAQSKIAVVKRNWVASKMNGDKKTATKAELVQFFLRLLNSTAIWAPVDSVESTTEGNGISDTNTTAAIADETMLTALGNSTIDTNTVELDDATIEAGAAALARAAVEAAMEDSNENL